MERLPGHAIVLLLALGVLSPGLPCAAHLSGDASDYRFLDGPEEVPLTPVGVQVRLGAQRAKDMEHKEKTIVIYIRCSYTAYYTRICHSP